ncbi:energy transducer TonB [Vogesella indigofera]|uniref:energy transducer TonB n=1 Tax=Vogesella indigofera TaxID=45465 RepID=UPI00234F7B76|nr:energy transducer TonB [Vogesella indigofera]MDC7702692.1 TonB family protein [Vogesella indigofera]
MESSFSRYTMLAAITAGHVGLLLSMSHAAPPAQPPQPLPMEMVTIPTPAPDVRPLPPAPAKTATAKPRKAAPAPRPLPAPVKPSPKAITTDTRAEAVTSKAPAVAETAVASPATSHSETSPPVPPAPVVPPTHAGGHLDNPRPVYPPLSIELGESGRVGLRVVVTTEGRAIDVSLSSSSGFPRLDRAALQAVRNWRFRPATRGNVPIQYPHSFFIEFDLSKA